MKQDYEWPPKQGFVITHYLTVADVDRSAQFYTDVLGGTVVKDGEPRLIELANGWVLLDVGGGPTNDKPTVTLTVPKTPDEISSFMNIRVSDVYACYETWKERGAEFITEPKEHARDIRCYMRDPDGYVIEVGQTKFT